LTLRFAAMRALFSATFCLLLSIAAAPARAQSVDQARTHYDAGRSYYEQLRYEDAAREFQEAYRLSGRSHLLKNVAVSHQHAEAWAEAISAFERYLEESPDAEDRAEIETRLARLRELAEEGADTDPDLADGNADRDLVAEEAPAERAPPREESGGFPTAFVATLGVGVAVGAGALITGLVAHGIYQDLESDCPMDACDPARESDADTGNALAVTSTVLTAVAGSLAVVALILLFTVDQNDEEQATATSFRVTPGPGDLGAAMEVAF
jgi:tetratricopeptide (TPR) repeat protein